MTDTASPHTATLDSLAPLDRAEIVSVDWSALAPDESKRLRALGLDEGARIAVAHRGVFFGKDPIALLVGRATIAVRRAHAKAMLVKPL
ncbi:FeoA family protein [Aurantiacibacter sp. D1-12]|uniref:FeoA family protein n=1 Tax=Aurantiacibacter sp. D1-12 TaxID=2993658 RepID=UPI00237D2656|nr:FeoA family protein [Aurantiacibacter sp. D1-12]MDE1467622.1 FeoA family protein [Aurantiacibacter sp. D1-12]